MSTKQVHLTSGPACTNSTQANHPSGSAHPLFKLQTGSLSSTLRTGVFTFGLCGIMSDGPSILPNDLVNRQNSIHLRVDLPELGASFPTRSSAVSVGAQEFRPSTRRSQVTLVVRQAGISHWSTTKIPNRDSNRRFIHSIGRIKRSPFSPAL